MRYTKIRFILLFLILIFITGCVKTIEEPLGLPLNIGTPSDIEEPIGLPTYIGTPPNLWEEEGYILYEDCKSENGNLLEVNNIEDGCPNPQTNLGRIYDIDCLCVCCA